MGDVILAKSPLSAASSTFRFPAILTLEPGDEATVFADGDPAEGAMRPIHPQAEGDDVSLLALTPSGARQWIHSLSVPAISVQNLRYIQLPGQPVGEFSYSTSEWRKWQQLRRLGFNSANGMDANADRLQLPSGRIAPGRRRLRTRGNSSKRLRATELRAS